ncbi:MAG: N-acetylmuramoyl-L-alanine amidase [Anaerotignum sp.]|nr:N-acetylmuramoyl-L-alanine amidase [Anaerotignum sp.]
MKGKNWREYEPYGRRRKKRRRRKGGMMRRGLLLVVLFALGYGGFLLYYAISRPYMIALDAGHGGSDGGAVGVIQEVTLTESTVEKLQNLLEADGRFRVVLSRKAGEGKSIDERNAKLRRWRPDILLSIHGNANEDSGAYGFECYPSPPGYDNHQKSLAFALLLAEEMEQAGAKLRGRNGVRFGYYVEGGKKMLVESDDTTVYPYGTFGMLRNMNWPAVLVEQCFVTNTADVENFGTEEGCQKAAEAYYHAICRYLEGE